MENRFNLADIIKKTSGLSILDKLNPDITWNSFNELNIMNELLFFYLNKLTALPMMDMNNFIDNLELNVEEFQEVKQFNEQLLNCQKMLQVFCIQTYIYNQTINNTFKDLIDAIPNEINNTTINEFMNTLDLFKKTNTEQSKQTAGGPSKIMLILIQLLILITMGMPSQVELSYCLQTNSTTMVPIIENEGLSNNSVDKLKTSNALKKEIDYIQQLNSVQTSTNITNTLIAVDSAKSKELSTLQKLLFLLLGGENETSRQLFIDMTINLNSKSQKISNELKNSCIDIMKTMNRQGVFKTFLALDDAEAEIKKMEDTEKKVNDSFYDAFTKISYGSTIAAVGVSQGEIATAMAGFYVATQGVAEITSFKTRSSQTVLKPDILSGLNSTEKFDYNIYHNNKANLACNFAYDLEVYFDDEKNSIQVIGGKYNYDDIKLYIETLKTNLKMQLTANKETPKMSALNSINERLEILYEITEHLNKLIINTNSRLIQIQGKRPTINTPNDIKNYFDSQLAQLDPLLDYLGQYNPLKSRDIEDDVNVAIENMQQAAKQQQISDIKNAIAQNQTAAFFSSWSKLVGISAKGVASLGTETITGVSGAAIDSVENIVRQTFDMSTRIAKDYPIQSLSILFMLLMIYDMIAGVPGKIIKFIFNGITYLIVMPTKQVSKGLLFVYKMISTPFGNATKLEKVLVVDNVSGTITNNEEQMSDLDAAKALIQLKTSKGGSKYKSKKNRRKYICKKTKKHKSKKNKTTIRKNYKLKQCIKRKTSKK
jgi:hypothetical protein